MVWWSNLAQLQLKLWIRKKGLWHGHNDLTKHLDIHMQLEVSYPVIQVSFCVYHRLWIKKWIFYACIECLTCGMIFSIKQVPRTSASAVAFGMGIFSGNGSLGPGKHRAFAVTSENRASDLHLRFFESCTNYKVFCGHNSGCIGHLIWNLDVHLAGLCFYLILCIIFNFFMYICLSCFEIPYIAIQTLSVTLHMNHSWYFCFSFSPLFYNKLI